MRNLSFYFKKMALKSLIFIIPLLILFFILGLSTFIYSTLLGLIFSGLIFQTFISSQREFSLEKKYFFVFFGFVTRLFLYAIPLVLAIFYKNYLNLLMVLVFLLFFPVLFVSGELVRGIKKIKKRKKSWIKSELST